MKRIVFILIILIFLLTCGCSGGKYVTRVCNEKNGFSRLAMGYEKFTGYKETEIKVKGNENIRVYADIVSDDGSLNASIIKKDGDGKEIVYQGIEVPTSTFSVKLSKPGTYILRLDGMEHTGSYCFEW